MRLWSLHPRFLDSKGIVALWREALLAQKVLQNRTKGYKHHPQLIRFNACRRPLAAIGTYLRAIHKEATQRGYRFDETKIVRGSLRSRLPVTKQQLRYEFQHLKRKLQIRDKAACQRLKTSRGIVPHPLFRIIPGGIESWERP